MTTECTTERLEFERFRRQRVVGRFDGGELGSDGGGLLLRELAQRTGVVFRIILHDDFRIISDANLVIIQIVSCRRELGARGLTEAAGSGKFPSGGTDDSDLFCFAADLQLNRGLDGSAVGWQGVVRSGTVYCRSRLRGLAGRPVGSGVGIAVAGRSSL